MTSSQLLHRELGPSGGEQGEVVELDEEAAPPAPGTRRPAPPIWLARQLAWQSRLLELSRAAEAALAREESGPDLQEAVVQRSNRTCKVRGPRT